MLRLSFVIGISAGIVASGWSSLLIAQNYPSKPLRIVNTGGSTDVFSRLIATPLSAALGQPVIVDNRTDVIAREIVAKASPDGYTLHVTGSGLWVEPLLRKMPFDPVRDFSPITLATTSPNVLVVHPQVPAKSVKELIALAKSKPRSLNFASGGTGGSAHMAAELFKSMAEIDIVHVPYKNTAQGVIGLLGGEVQLMFTSAQAVATHVKSGKLRALGIGSAQPSALMPGLATIASTGVAGFESASTQSVFVPARTPAAIVSRLNQEIVRIINAPEMKEPIGNSGLEIVGGTPEHLRSYIESEMTRLRKVIKESGIRVD